MASSKDKHVPVALGPAFLVAVARIAVGWHLLYEGFNKLFSEQWHGQAWTAEAYLANATGPAAGFFQSLAEQSEMMFAINQLNIWGLILVGACLMLGCVTRFAALCGAALMILYYAANIPWVGLPPVPGAVGNHLIVNPTLVEGLLILAFIFYPANQWGLDGLIARLFRSKKTKEAIKSDPDLRRASRRQALASLLGVPVVGGFAWAVLKHHGYVSHEEDQLAEKLGETADATSGATIRTFDWKTMDDLKAKPPMAKIGDLELSRLILGGNLIGGWAHARDLLYVNDLVKKYHHPQKIFETFAIAEQCGVNAVLTNPQLCSIILRYWDEHEDGKIHFLSDCAGKGSTTREKLLQGIDESIKSRAASCYVQGGLADRLVAEGDFDTIREALDIIRKASLPAGIGGHKIETVRACVDEGISPDYWMKTIHKTNYWSATETCEKDNIWCEKPDETIAFMEGLEEPWIAFKILAAGAYRPKEGFPYAFESGADFICVGMYDFQIVEDVNLVCDVLGKEITRTRPWRAETTREIEAVSRKDVA